jgi:tetratricopeptide (TPR) repeat protein
MIRRRPWLAPVLVFAAVLLAYYPALRGGFVWNDPDYVTRPELRGWHGLEQIWFEPGATEQYYPVLHTAFWVEHRAWGDSPVGYHLANLLLHAAAACLFLLVLRRLLAESGRAPAVAADAAAFAALLFALHPVCVESVAWISEQKNTLSLVFFLAAALAYLRGRGRGKMAHGVATGLFLLAVLSKSMAATLPAALLVVAWWTSGRLAWRRDVLPLLPWLAIGAADGLFTAWVERRFIGAEGPEFALSLTQRCLVAGHAAWFYLGKLAWPAPLMFMYPRWNVSATEWRLYLLPLAALVALAGLWRLRRRSRGPLAAALLYLGLLFPVLGFFNVYAFVFSFVADHFQYLACLPVLATLGVGWAGWADRGGRRFLPVAAAAAALLTLGTLTWRQCGDYRDITTLYRATLAKNPDAWLAHYNLGNLLRESGQAREAIDHYQAALRLNPGHAGEENNLGLALVETGQPAAAVPHYRRALQLQPRYAAAQNNLGAAEWALGQGAAAVAAYRAAVQLQPGYPEAWYNLGLAYSALGRPAEAVDALDRAVRLRPAFGTAALSLAGARNNLGNALFSAGQRVEALAQFQEAARLDPSSAPIQQNLAVALRAAGRPAEAADHYALAQRLAQAGRTAPAAP